MSRTVCNAIEQLVETLTFSEKLRIFQKVEREVKPNRASDLLRRIRSRNAKRPISERQIKRVCDEVRQELYEKSPSRSHRH